MLLAAGLLACAIAPPTALAGPGPASAAKKCRKGHAASRCRRRRPALSISPLGQDFGTIGSVDSSPVDFTVTNVGRRKSGTPFPSLSGSGARYFRINGTSCAAPLSARASCTVTVQSVGNDGATGIGELDVLASPGGRASAPLIVNLF